MSQGLRAAQALTVVPYVTLDKGYWSSWPAGVANFAVRRSAVWQRLWAIHAPGSTPPAVDFGQYDVYCAFLGQQTSGGIHVDFEAIVTDGLTVDATVKSTFPGMHCNVIQVMTNPFHFVIVPKLGLPIQFIENAVVIDCL
jgi:hypothetical protein